MFTGLVECMGTVARIRDAQSGRRLTIELRPIREGLALGDSIAINGCCLTVVDLGEHSADFEAGPETLVRTNIGRLSPGDPVNLERALSAGARLGGHIVQGHVDGTATIAERRTDGEWEIVQFTCGDLASQLVSKGSVAVDGVSLTVCDVTSDSFTVMLIPHTMDVTTLGKNGVGDVVNIETDILGKYVFKMIGQLFGEGSSISIDKLREAGIIQ